MTPAGLYYLGAVLMLAVAAYAAALLPLALRWRRPGLDVELSHLAMGAAMAGMFVSAWSFGPALAWELVFGALLVWFAARALGSLRESGFHLPHTAVHALMSVAMLLMYVTAPGSRVGEDLRGTGLTLLVAVLLLASAVSTLAADSRGWPVYGSRPDPLGAAPVPSLERPALLDASHVVMAVAMGFMLLLGL